MKITIVDSLMANLRSISNALDYLGFDYTITSDAGELEKAGKILIPGVGSYSSGMKSLNRLGLTDVIRHKGDVEKVPILGICIGMQLLTTLGYEGGIANGIGFFDGVVEQMNPTTPECRVPQYGWVPLDIVHKDTCLLKGISANMDFYFVHSYSVKVADEFVSSTYKFGTESIVASIEKGNVWGTQFHPEKSKLQGLQVLKNFGEFNGAE